MPKWQHRTSLFQDRMHRFECCEFAQMRIGGLPDGHVVGKPTPLFPRVENV